jgi:hypothetical protein
MPNVEWNKSGDAEVGENIRDDLEDGGDRPLEIGYIRKLHEQEETDLRHEVAGGGFALDDENFEKIERIGDERMEHGHRPDGPVGARLTVVSG